MRHKNRSKYIENFHLCKEKAEKQSKKKIENEQKEGNIDEIRITAIRDCKFILVTEKEYPLHLKKDQTVFLDKNFKERGRKTK